MIARRRASLLVAVLAGGACAPGCAGLNARQKLLLPRLADGWKDVASDVAVGAETLPAAQATLAIDSAAALGDAIEAKSYAGIAAAPWAATIKPTALAGISERVRRGQISVAASASFVELVNAFDAGLAKFLERGE